MNYCALCCIAKDEDLFLKEWLTYHALIGFEHFFIYDNLSTVPITVLLDGWASPDRVTVIRNPVPLNQNHVYRHCLERYGSRFKWIAFLDVDEFIRLTPRGSERADIRTFLAEFEPYAGVGLNWRTFSSGGRESTPTGAVIGNYTLCLGDDRHIKSVVQPAKIRGCAGPHSFYPKRDAYAVNSAHYPIPPGLPFSIPATGKACVNHYFYKSRQCFAHKIAKGNPCNIERRMQEFDRHLSLPVEKDERLVAYAPRIAALLADTSRELYRPQPPLSPEPGEPQAHEATHGSIAREWLSQGKYQQALLHLCYAVLDYDASEDKDPADMLSIWTARAEAALTQGDRELAEHCLREAMKQEAGRDAFALLARLRLLQKEPAASRALLDILQAYEAFEQNKPGRQQ